MIENAKSACWDTWHSRFARRALGARFEGSAIERRARVVPATAPRVPHLTPRWPFGERPRLCSRVRPRQPPRPHPARRGNSPPPLRTSRERIWPTRTRLRTHHARTHHHPYSPRVVHSPAPQDPARFVPQSQTTLQAKEAACPSQPPPRSCPPPI